MLEQYLPDIFNLAQSTIIQTNGEYITESFCLSIELLSAKYNEPYDAVFYDVCDIIHIIQ